MGSKIHFMGICGTAMAAVAAALKDLGYEVSGSDANVYPPMSTFLEKRGISFKNGFRPENLIPLPDLVIVGNAISRGNPEIEEVLDRKMRYLSLPAAIQEFFLHGKRNLVVTGTHGKTTTSSILAWILECAGKKPSYLIGGIPKNLGQGASFRDSEFVVLEGDEYDTAFFDKHPKFLHYLPEVVIINNIEFDHADIYKDLDAIKTSFERLVRIIPRNGLLAMNGDDSNARDVSRDSIAPVLKIGFSKESDLRITGLKWEAPHSFFALETGGRSLELKSSLAGEFNARNVAMAASVAIHLGIPDAAIQKAVESFEGVRRRQEIRAVVNGITLIDDFGHHPTAIRETLIALRGKHPEGRLWAFFEPRSNTTRRAVFQKELPEALALADGVFVSQVARLEQIPAENRLDPEKVMAAIRSKGREAHYLPTAAEIVEKAAPRLHPGDVAVIFSNGSFDGIHEKLEKALEGGVRSAECGKK